jgi:phospholipase/lecithinase/hemolysin
LASVLSLQQLYQQGARRIAILGMPPVGCVPSQRTLAGGLARDCDPARNHAAQLYNSRLKEEIARLQKELQCQKIGYVDIYDILQDMITNPCKYGARLDCLGRHRVLTLSL